MILRWIPQRAVDLMREWRTANWPCELGRWRYLVIAAFTLALTLALRPTWTDWRAYRTGFDQLASSTWGALYVDQPATQIGPLGLVFGVLPEIWAQVVAAVLIVPACVLLDRVADRALLLPSVVLAIGWSVVAVHVQPADLLVVACFLGALLAVRREDAVSAGLLVGTATLIKPWGVVLLPVLLTCRRPMRGLVAATLVAAAYAPFVVDRAAWSAGAPQLGVNLGSILRLFTETAPTWWRLLQLALCLLLGFVAAQRGGWAPVLLAVTGSRLLMDPSSYPYQAFAPLAGAVVLDAIRRAGHATYWAFALLLLSGPWLAVHFQSLAIGGRAVCLVTLIALTLRRGSESHESKIRAGAAVRLGERYAAE